ncbi:DEAD-like helicase [Hyphomicrobium denitrificans ATCC 51888]|uniref:DEAD-like helicase n=1 Tax=Hyphomicrobium denitrificans (strain ATCC 51888 / DSM 1869 / NCIMB 11706 / TK 0415) TaxID=582899 RepID=D8JVV5_HYPDA|nr:DEAD/DEAH box helicase [Hyphomicrobium denitrificans]ADJ22994.1 DEAD-like helicase [Hyphomicrobium denitrificans ATCC 51888]
MKTLLDHQRTYGAIEHDGNAWKITELEPHVAIMLKANFPRIPKTAKPPFTISGGAHVDATLAWFLLRFPLRISDADKTRMDEQKTLFEVGQKELGAILAPGWMPSKIVGFKGNQRPWNYQSAAAELARRTGRLLLMDELGLGKTVSAIAAIVAPDYLPAMVVPQTHLPEQWAIEIGEFTTLTTHIIKRTKPYELPRADVYINPYSKLAGWIDYAPTAGFKSIVFDEIQELRNGIETSKGISAKRFCEQASLIIGLSGTPIYNYASETWQICNFLEEGVLGTFDEFKTEWCEMGPGGKWIVTDPQALGTHLREIHLSLRRTRADIGDERRYPNKIIHEIPFDAQSFAADAGAIRALAERVTATAPLARGEAGNAAREFDLRMRHATGVAKAPQVAAFVKILLEARQPVVLCGWHRDVYEIWARELADFNPVFYTGTETPRQKKKSVQMFCEGHSNLFILSLRSGAGLNGLQHRCRTIVFGELDWSPKVHEQCTGRLDRPGQEQQVDEIYLHADGGSDPSMIGVLALKSSQSQGIVDPFSAPRDQISDVSRIRELAELYLQGNSHLAAPAPKPKRMSVASEQNSLF